MPTGAPRRGVRSDAAEQRAISARTKAILDSKRAAWRAAGQPVTTTSSSIVDATIPVYVHVMRDSNGNGDVSDAQISQQTAVLNTTYAGGESAYAADTGFSFRLAGVDRYNNTRWHQRSQQRQVPVPDPAGRCERAEHLAGRLRLPRDRHVPWDYDRNPKIDGIRVQYSSLPGGSTPNYNMGETTTHEAGHWLGLWHTFQGGCTTVNDEVSDTPAQSSRAAGARPAGTPAGCPARIRSTTTWTTPTTPATTGSPPARASG